MSIYDLLTEHAISVRDISKQYQISNSTLAETFSRPVDTWPVKILRATAEQLELPVDDLIDKMVTNEQPLTPFIKWVGGKRQLLGKIDELLPSHYNTYFEPFLGGGAVLLHLKPNRAVVNDLNEELTNTWRTVKENTQELRELLRVHQGNNSKEYFLDLRSVDRDGRIEKFSNIERAARFIYLNKTAFNGMWRVNSKGQHNVPYGKYKNPKIDNEMIQLVADYLNSNDITIKTGDYRDSLATATRGDFVYFDSPYDVVSKTAAFTSYTADGFNKDDQEILRDVYASLTAKGVKVMESNADTEYINELYLNIPGVEIHKVSAKRMINSKGNKRGPVGELLITNYKTNKLDTQLELPIDIK